MVLQGGRACPSQAALHPASRPCSPHAAREMLWHLKLAGVPTLLP